YVKILLGIIILLIGLYVVNLLKPELSKNLLKLFKKDLVETELISKKKYDSLETVRQTDYLKYIDELHSRDIEINDIKEALNLEKQKSYRYEKELNNYRLGDFNERFSKFSSLIKKDSLE